jgi:hypothetical protein
VVLGGCLQVVLGGCLQVVRHSRCFLGFGWVVACTNPDHFQTGRWVFAGGSWWVFGGGSALQKKVFTMGLGGRLRPRITIQNRQVGVWRWFLVGVWRWFGVAKKKFYNRARWSPTTTNHYSKSAGGCLEVVLGGCLEVVVCRPPTACGPLLPAPPLIIAC